MGAGPRWRALDNDARAALVGLVVLLAAALAVRAWLVVGYPPAFVGFPDSHEYVLAAALNVFRDVQHPAGYPLFLGGLHILSDRLSFTIVVQHILGLATGLLLYESVRSTGGPPWLGLLPAAVVFFGGTGLLLEHSLLADPLFAFLQAVGVYTAIRALGDPAFRWTLLTGLAIGLAFWVKTVAISSAVLVPLLILFAAPGSTRRRLLSAATVALVVTVMIGTYVGSQALVTGYVGYERQSAWNLYGRVATFVDCSRFTPPRGTRFLCPAEPLAHRAPQAFYQYGPASPAVRHFGGPSRAPGYANGVLQRFSLSAIEHEPLAYARAIVHGLSLYISPRQGEGYPPEAIRDALLETSGERSIQPAITLFYPGSVGYDRPADATRDLADYERQTRIQGPVLVLLLLAAVLGVPFLPTRMRPAATLFTLTAVCSIVFAVAGSSYDARYAYPTFGPLAAGAAVGAWGIARQLRDERERRRTLTRAANPPAGACPSVGATGRGDRSRRRAERPIRPTNGSSYTRRRDLCNDDISTAADDTHHRQSRCSGQNWRRGFVLDPQRGR